MDCLTQEYIKKNIADSSIIFQRGLDIYEYGALVQLEKKPGFFLYEIEGDYGDYLIELTINKNNNIEYSCTCPYPGSGCKHVVAAMLDISDNFLNEKSALLPVADPQINELQPEKYLTMQEIKEIAVEDRKKRAARENFILIEGDIYKDEHLIKNEKGKTYSIIMHNPETASGTCSCPDFNSNKLGICKHILFTSQYLKKKKDFKKRIKLEKLPFAHIYWDSLNESPKLFHELSTNKFSSLIKFLNQFFDQKGNYIHKDLETLMILINKTEKIKQLRIEEEVLKRLNNAFDEKQLKELSKEEKFDFSTIKTELYPYQKEGVEFCVYKKGALVGDEMGLGKTVQAIAASLIKRKIFGFKKVLIITMASLKEQWKREIKKFSDEDAVIIEGTAKARQNIYKTDSSFFKITNYEAVLRDILPASRFKPDIIILDEAQRIKNFNTKTADAVKSIPKKHAIVLTGTPLENKLEDTFSIIQFLDPDLLSPLWEFAGNHFMLDRNKKDKICGYRNLNSLNEKIRPIVIRRKKKEVLKELPDITENNYYISLTKEQAEIHSGYLQVLIPILNKKFLTPVDLRRIQELMLKMRQVCNSTYLIDKKTNISPKLKELESILEEVVIENNRKVVIFSEWTTMNYLIARHLSKAKIHFVELSGKIPAKKRQPLIDEFSNNPDCKVFLSSDAGGTGLNLQAADCVINFELPWNPGKLNQRIGRINRIGQESQCINVINLISKHSIEEKIFAGIQLKTDLFNGVFDGGIDIVEFSGEKKTNLINKLRDMFNEEHDLAPREISVSPEIPEDTPYFRNPEVLGKDEEEKFDFYENDEQPDYQQSNIDSENQPENKETNIFENQSAEKIENVLNSGMEFVGGLIEMATGQKIQTSSNDGKMITMDKNTGEVTIKFKLAI